MRWQYCCEITQDGGNVRFKGMRTFSVLFQDFNDSGDTVLKYLQDFNGYKMKDASQHAGRFFSQTVRNWHITLSVFKTQFFLGGLKKKFECCLIFNSSCKKTCTNFHADKMNSWVTKFSGIIQKQRTWPAAVRGIRLLLVFRQVLFKRMVISFSGDPPAALPWHVVLLAVVFWGLLSVCAHESGYGRRCQFTQHTAVSLTAAKS